MKKAILLSAVLMLCTALMLAQDTTSSSSSQSGSSASSQTGPSGTSDQTAGAAADQNSATAGNTLQGCLSGSSGNYMLTDATGVTWQLQGDESQFSANVNKEVEVMGTPGAKASASASNGPDTSAAGNASAGSASGTPDATQGTATGSTAHASANASKTLDVTSIRKVADSCSNQQTPQQ
jgi:uncharacterized protein YdeI (BOF family)